MTQSVIFNEINKCLNFVQSKLSFLKESSLIFQYFDNVVFFFIALTVISGLFCSTDAIGICIFFTLFSSVINILISKEQKFNPKSFDIAIFIFLLISIISMINSTLPMASLKGLFKTLTYIGFYFSVVQFLSYNKSKIKYFVLLISGCILFESIIAIIQNHSNVLPLASWQDLSKTNPEDVLSRAFGTLKPYNPNLLAAYLIVGCPLILKLTIDNLYNRVKFPFGLCLMAFLTSLLAIVYTGSRGAYLALSGILLAIILITYRFIFVDFNNDFYKKWWKKVVLTGAGIATFLIISTPSILKRILSIFLLRGDSSTSFRMNVYNSSIEMFLDNPLLGIGLGNTTFREIYGYYMMSGFDALSAYSIYLETAVETGILGLLAFLSFLFLLLKPSVKIVLSDVDVKKKFLVSCCLLSLIGVMVHGLFDTVFYRPQVQTLFWFMVAILNVELNNFEKI
ncbi:O-antigen ligase family protein [bacterium]|nr:O-antigen ligase family protein [bacterium]